MPRLSVVALASSLLSALAGAACTPSGPGAPAPIGIATCDDYVAKVDACLATHPALKPSFEPAFRARRDAWKQMALTDKASLTFQCKLALDTLASALPGCS